MTTKISTDNIQPNTVVSYAEFSSTLVPKISTVNVANSTYSILDDTAVNVGGGYVVITGAGFNSGSQVLIDVTPATSTTYVNATTLKAQVPTKSAATYNIYVVNPDGGTATRINGLTYSGTPTWVTASTLSNVQSNIAFTGSLSATGAATYNVATGSTLPTGMTLVSANGYYYGTISVGELTTYNFTIDAIDAELQESPRTFSLTTTVSNAPPTVEYIVVAGGGGGNRAPSPGGYGGGGGAGGLLTGNLSITTATSYTVTVGGGGGAQSANGSNSVFDTIVARGGGLGGTNSLAGQNGGSGGGVYNGTVGRGIYPGSTFISAARQGYDGGSATPNYQGGGGGGAGGSPPDTITGGIGLADSALNGILSASSTGVVSPSPGARYIAGGGAGGGGGSAYLGGLGGGGNGGFGFSPGNGTSGTTNSGGGGGGGNYGTPAYSGGNGGSGIVIIRYTSNYDAAASTTGSPTVSTSGSYRYYVFTGSGSITW